MCKGKGTTEIFNTGIAEVNIWLRQTTLTDMEDIVIYFLVNSRNEGHMRDWIKWKGSGDIKEALVEQEHLSAEAFFFRYSYNMLGTSATSIPR